MQRKSKRTNREKIRICQPPAQIIMTWISAVPMDPFRVVKIHRRFRHITIVTKGKLYNSIRFSLKIQKIDTKMMATFQITFGTTSQQKRLRHR